MNILHIDSSILGGASASRKLSAEIVARLQADAPGAAVTHRDLAGAPLAHLTAAHLGAAQLAAADRPAALAADLDAGAADLRDFLAADTVVIGVAVYNFTVPTQLKAWIDRILVAGQTFRYGPDGRPEGLAGGKRVILAVARGGFYGADSPMASFEHAETYLRGTFAFIGIPDPEIVVAEGLAAGPDARDAGLAAAERQIEALAA